MIRIKRRVLTQVAALMVPGGGGGGTTTFDPSHAGTGFILSGGNLQATNAAGGSDRSFVRTVASHSTGKFYSEFTFSGTFGNNYQVGLGICNSTANPNTTFSFTDANDGGVWNADANFYINNASAGIATTYVVSNTVGMAIDIGAQLIWFRANTGNWNNSGIAIPATGVGGVSLATMAAGPYFCAVGVLGDSLATVIANFGGSAYANFDSTVTGFGNW